jgi:hypothetical protein
MRRERGSTVAVRASSVASGDVGRLNADIGLPKEGPGGAVCPLDAGHCDAKFVKVLSVKDPKLISDRQRNDLMDALKLSHSSGDLEMVPHIESCLRDLEMHDAEYAAELAQRSGEQLDAACVPAAPAGAVQQPGPGEGASPASPAAARCLPAASAALSPAATSFSPSAAPYSPMGSQGGGWTGSASPSAALNRSGSFNQKIWLDGELLDASALDEPDDSDDEYADQSYADQALDDDDDEAALGHDDDEAALGHDGFHEELETSVAGSVDGAAEEEEEEEEEEGEQAAAEEVSLRAACSVALGIPWVTLVCASDAGGQRPRARVRRRRHPLLLPGGRRPEGLMLPSCFRWCFCIHFLHELAVDGSHLFYQAAGGQDAWLHAGSELPKSLCASGAPCRVEG